MYFTDEEWLAFAQRLRRATDAGRLQWEIQDPWTENVFIVTVPGNAVYKLASRDEDGQFPYVLEIKDLDGTKVSEFTTVAYANSWDPSPAESASSILDSLYRDVGRLVTGAPQRAQSLLDGLGELAPPEEDPF